LTLILNYVISGKLIKHKKRQTIMKKQIILKGCTLCFLLMLLTIFSNASFSQIRQEISLNGTWDFKWDNEDRLAYPPDDKGWTTIEVTKKSRSETGFGKEGTNHWAWYKRNVHVPGSMKGQRVKIRFTIVKYKAYVYWNGKKVGEHLDGDIPFEIDVTDHAKFNADNELLVGVIDRISLQRPDMLPYVESDFGGKSVNPPRGSVLAPASATESIFGGICDDVDLVSYPEVYIEDFHITTSVRRSEISIEVTALNESTSQRNYDVGLFIEDKGNNIKEFPKEAVRTEPGKKVKVLFRDKWENPHLWSHQDPYLYTVVMQLRKGNQVTDEKRFRFGFREFWIEGINFYLNGKVFKIRRNPTSGLRGRSVEEIRKWLEELKSININQVRIHHSGFPERIAEVADEVGMTLCTESTFWSRAPWYDTENPEMWENAKIHWDGLVKMFKNHPSVVMYSIENEMLSTGAYLEQQDPAKWRRYQDKWIEVGEFVRNLDPTKPLQYSWGHDIRGWVETANIHYVRDIKYFFQYPRDLYWLEGENLTQSERNYDYKWIKDRPLIKGEFEYWYHSNPPHGLTSFIGEDAYIGDNWSKTWKWCMKKKMEAYRYSGIVANPWSFDEDRVKFFPPQEVFLKDWRANFYGGERMRKEIIAVNEDYDPVSLQLDVNLSAGGRILSQKSFLIEMSEGSKWIKDVEFDLPETDTRINADLNMKLVSNGKELYSNQYPVHIFPKIQPVEYNVNTTGLYDPDGKTFREMTYCGFTFTRINEISNKEVSGLKVLIIGKDAVTPQYRERGKILNEFVEHGGRLILLEQALVEKFDWLPFELGIDKTRSSTDAFSGRTDLPILEDIRARGLNATIAFKMMPDHPILENIEADDLKYWRGTHQVSKNNFYRPKFWNYNTVAYTGSGNGIEHTPLVTLPYGSGLFIMSQFIISEEMSKEPAAFILFNNILKYAHSYSESSSRAGILADEENSTKRIITLFGAEVDQLDEFPPVNLNSYQVLFIDGSINLEKYKTALDKFLAGGGKIVLRELTPEKFSNVRCILPDDLSLKPMPEPVSNENIPRNRDWCPASVIKTEYDPLLAGITNFELYWRTPSGYTKMFGDEIAPIASYVMTGKNVNALTEPAVIAKIQSGKGEIIIDQIDWGTGLDKVTDNTCRIISNFLNNLGIKMRPNNTYN
jgi:beta-galactosidase